MRGEKPQLKDPCLVNSGGDPLLNGCLLYSLPKGQAVVIGTDPSCTICVNGLGVQRQMCQIVNRDGENVDIFVGESARDEDASSSGLFKTGLVNVYINNVLTSGQASLEHGDSIRLGSTHSFQLIAKDVDQEPWRMGHNLAADPGRDIFTPEHQVQLRERYGPQRALSIVANFRGMRPLLEEANKLTEELRMDRDFELVFDFAYVTGDPEATVVLHKRSKSADCSDALFGQPRDTVMCLWTVEKFRNRLEVMRHIYAMVNERGQPWGQEDDPNPWMDDAGVPFVNPGVSSTASSSQARLSENVALYAELEQLRHQVIVQSDELEVMASLRDRLVQDLVNAQQDNLQLQAKLSRQASDAKVEAKVAARQEEVKATLRPSWLEVLGALRDRRKAIDVPQMHRWLEPHERVLDYAQALHCDVDRMRRQAAEL